MHQLHMMLNEKDYAHLKEQQRRSGISTSALIRSLLAGLEIKEHPTETTIEVCRELKAIGNNLNQLTWAANRGAPVSTEQLTAIRQELDRLWFWAKFDSNPPETRQKYSAIQQDRYKSYPFVNYGGRTARYEAEEIHQEGGGCH